MREKNGMPLSELEQLTDISHTTMVRLFSLTDDTSPSFENVLKIVTALGGSLDELTGAKTADMTETPLTRAYNQLLEEKDKMIAEKDDHIHRLQESSRTQRREKYVLAAVLIAVLAVVAVVLIVDVTNGNMGYVRY